VFLRDRVRRALDTLTGLTLVAFGVRLAAARD
jgi:threonine/homoserine/homoserine lactone efflux protein